MGQQDMYYSRDKLEEQKNVMKIPFTIHFLTNKTGGKFNPKANSANFVKYYCNLKMFI